MGVVYVACGCYIIFRASRRLPDGQIVYARDYGLRAFKIVIRCKLHGGK